MKKTDEYTLSNKIDFNREPTQENITGLQNKLWYIIKSEEGNQNSNQKQTITNEDYSIIPNDIIKLGRVKYSFNEFNHIKPKDQMDVDQQNESIYNITSVNKGTLPVFNFIFNSKTIDTNSKEKEEVMCKICLSGGSDETNPLVSLCKCTGGIGFAHYDCLKQWMQTKLSKKENDRKTVTSYNIKSFNCEICKTPYPFRFVVNIYQNRTYDLIDIVRPVDASYIILESLNQMKDNNNNLKSIHVIILDEQKITLGRGHEADVRINDISVSRQHAVLLFDNSTGKIVLRDLKSKFGTLILIKNDFKVKEKKIQLQIGRTFMEGCLVPAADCEKFKKTKQIKKESDQLKGLNMNINNLHNFSLNQENEKDFPGKKK